MHCMMVSKISKHLMLLFNDMYEEMQDSNEYFKTSPVIV